MREKALFLDHFIKVHSKNKAHKLKSMRPKRNAKPVLIVNKLMKILNPRFGNNVAYGHFC